MKIKTLLVFCVSFLCYIAFAQSRLPDPVLSVAHQIQDGLLIFNSKALQYPPQNVFIAMGYNPQTYTEDGLFLGQGPGPTNQKKFSAWVSKFPQGEKIKGYAFFSTNPQRQLDDFQARITSALAAHQGNALAAWYDPQTIAIRPDSTIAITSALAEYIPENAGDAFYCLVFTGDDEHMKFYKLTGHPAYATLTSKISQDPKKNSVQTRVLLFDSIQDRDAAYRRLQIAALAEKTPSVIYTNESESDEDQNFLAVEVNNLGHVSTPVSWSPQSFASQNTPTDGGEIYLFHKPSDAANFYAKALALNAKNP